MGVEEEGKGGRRRLGDKIVRRRDNAEKCFLMHPNGDREGIV